MIDVVAILPFDKILSAGNVNGLVRVARIGKLYKLVKITRLIRLFKVIKQQGKIFGKLNDIFKIGHGLERLMFFIMIFLMLSHLMACLWIFTADLSIDEPIMENINNGNSTKTKNQDEYSTNWVIDGGYQDLDWSDLYLASFYFTVTTITTVGYGDISGTNFTERLICIFLMITGVLFFSFSSGTLT